jgi:3-deoxy-D-manno-octulosonic-acid transferase
MLGAQPERVQVSGNLKFDMAPVDADGLRRRLRHASRHRGPGMDRGQYP